MFKKQIKTLFAILAEVLFFIVLASCAPGGDAPSQNGEKIEVELPYVGTDRVMYDKSSEGNEIGAVIKIVTKNKNPDIKVLEVSGMNTSGVVCKLEDSTFDSLDGKRINSLYIKQIALSVITAADYVEIDSVTLSIDGEIKEYPFKYPLIHRGAADDIGGDLYFASFPSLITGHSLREGYEYNYYFFTEQKPVTLEDAHFRSFLDLKESVIVVNGMTVGALEDILPLDIPANSKVTLKTKLDLKPELSASYYENVYTELIMGYLQDGEKYELKMSMTVQGIGNKEGGIAFLNCIEEKK